MIQIFLGQFFYSQGGSVLDTLVYIFLLQKELWGKAPTPFKKTKSKKLTYKLNIPRHNLKRGSQKASLVLSLHTVALDPE